VIDATPAGAAGRPTRASHEEAPAKINLRLRVLRREADGYHRLDTVFQALELADGVDVTLVHREGIELDVRGVPEGSLGSPAENLAARAAARLFAALDERRVPRPRGVAIRLDKRIPHGAGLGGGSSDAAAVLRALHGLLDRPLARSELAALGASLGADVPFFLSGSARALGRGRGDEITPLPALPRRPVLLVVPEPGVATAWAYGVLAAERARTGPDLAPSADVEQAPERDWDDVARVARNDFEDVLFSHRPDLARAKAALVEAGAQAALLAGSGSAVFGIFADDAARDHAAERLARTTPAVRILRTSTAV
jgi:4-diphosphocytidyl-2-C-methyl-D-erythritol kinase